MIHFTMNQILQKFYKNFRFFWGDEQLLCVTIIIFYRQTPVQKPNFFPIVGIPYLSYIALSTAYRKYTIYLKCMSSSSPPQP